MILNGILLYSKLSFDRFLCLNFTLVSICCGAALSDDLKEEIVAAHNILRKNFAKGSEGTLVGNMKKLVSILVLLTICIS